MTGMTGMATQAGILFLKTVSVTSSLANVAWQARRIECHYVAKNNKSKPHLFL